MTFFAVNLFLLGASAMGSITAGVFFFRFYRDTKDSFFLLFGLAFLLLAVDRAALALLAPQGGEENQLVYLPRLAAFLMIIVAIVSKNRRGSGVQ